MSHGARNKFDVVKEDRRIALADAGEPANSDHHDLNRTAAVHPSRGSEAY